LRLTKVGGEVVQFVADGASRRECVFPMEAERGYASRGWEWSPGYFAITLAKNAATCLIAGTEPWHTLLALDPDEAHRFELERRRRLVRFGPSAGAPDRPVRVIFAPATPPITRVLYGLG
jgi:hypothetical protein